VPPAKRFCSSSPRRAESDGAKAADNACKASGATVAMGAAAAAAAAAVKNVVAPAKVVASGAGESVSWAELRLREIQAQRNRERAALLGSQAGGAAYRHRPHG
jgi:hypothetical protein